MTQEEQALVEQGAEKIKEAVDKERVEELKDEIERIETGLPNAAKLVQGIKDKQEKAPPREPNSPEISTEDAERIAAEEAEKYAEPLGIQEELAKKKGEILGRIKPLTQPTMAGGRPPIESGPRRPAGAGAQVGPRPDPVGPKVTPGKAPVGNGPRMAQLDQLMILKVELLATKKKLAEADEKMGLWAVQDARRRKDELNKEEAALMVEVSKQLGVPTGSNIRLVDKERGICQVE